MKTTMNLVSSLPSSGSLPKLKADPAFELRRAIQAAVGLNAPESPTSESFGLALDLKLEAFPQVEIRAQLRHRFDPVIALAYTATTDPTVWRIVPVTNKFPIELRSAVEVAKRVAAGYGATVRVG